MSYEIDPYFYDDYVYCPNCGHDQFEGCGCPPEDDLAHQLLHLPMEENDAQAATVGEYLGLLLSTLWLQADGFSGKRPFGNSDWQYAVYKALGKAGFVEITFDEDGYIDEFTSDEEYKADELVLQAIKLAYNHG